MKHLNILSRSNFLNNETESTEDFIKDLNKMIKMEGFSEMLKEKTLPLEWFGLYLQSNIENIPLNYKRNNYLQLYNELIQESNENLEKIKNDDSLNIIYDKIINSEKAIDIISNGLKRITNNEKFEIFFFILKRIIEVEMAIYFNKDDIISKIEIVKKEEQPQQKKNNLNLNFLKIGKDKENEELNNGEIKYYCNNILDFCDYFPSLTFGIITNYFNYQEEIKIKSFLDDYFALIRENIMKEPMFKEYEEDEKKNIQSQIENFIHAQIYNKIFNNKEDETDLNIYENCEKFRWIKAQDLDLELKYVDNFSGDCINSWYSSFVFFIEYDFILLAIIFPFDLNLNSSLRAL